MPREKINRRQIDLSEISENNEKKQLLDEKLNSAYEKTENREKKYVKEKIKSEKNKSELGTKMDKIHLGSEDMNDFFDKEFQFVEDGYFVDNNSGNKIDKMENTNKRIDDDNIYQNESKSTRNGNSSSHLRDNKDITKKKKGISPWIFLSIFTLVLLIIIGGIYGVGYHYYDTHFLRGTIINGIDVSNMTYDELANRLTDYSIIIKQRGKEIGSQYVEKINGTEFGIELLSESGVVQILENQDKWKWYEPSGKIYEQDKLIGFDETKLEERIMALKGFQKGQFNKPTNATISSYDAQKGFTIVPEKQGNALKKKTVLEVVKNAVTDLSREIDLDKHNCYKKPKINTGNKKLNNIVKKLNKYISVKITYNFGEKTEVVDGREISKWMIVDEEKGEVTLDREKVGEYVATLRKKYDTIFRPRDFKTKSGKTVKLDNGDYGWWMNYVEETKQLADQIEAGKSGTRTPVYYQTAAQYGSKDYGNTYVEINLTSQKLFVFVDGKVKLKTDICTGNTSLGRGTNTGVFGITYKERYGVLVGETYESTVAYWMPFDGDIGLHDAIWKTQFGSDFYKKEGSHGCVNLPYNKAKKIYSLVEKNTPVIVYELPGSESDDVTIQSYEEIAKAAIEAIEAIGTVTKDSEEDIKTARYMYNKIGKAGQKYVKNYSVLTKAEKEYKTLIEE